ncbi:unnamed protein product [Lymnaea stagnalis]|uniref:Glycosyltransferase family 92 protein n=1 Tax=Lymnaea stagnalis TaxID=6523 RepID=A0AAV2H357_LYMST
MRFNLTKVVRGVTVAVLVVISINLFVFLQSAHTGYTNGRDALWSMFKDKYHPQSRAVVSLNSTEACKGLTMKVIDDQAGFQTVDGSSAQVYSAFVDNEILRIIALHEVARPSSELYCQVWYHGVQGDPLEVVSAKVDYIAEDHGRRFSAAYITCNIPGQRVPATPYAVSVVTARCGRPTNVLPLPGPSPAKLQFTVCVTPLNFKYSRAYELVEMIELNKILGAQRIVFYNHSTGPNVDKVLEFYSRAGDIEVLPWHITLKTETWPPSGDPDVHYFAQLAALNDCLHRYRDRSQYLVYTDIDEFIIPRSHDDWAGLVREQEKSSPKFSSLLVQCTFFRKEWPKPAPGFEKGVQMYNPVILKYTSREKQIYPHNSRSKYLLNPQLVKTVGVHFIWENTGAVVKLQEPQALLHHYRTWESPEDQQPRVDDLTAVNKYGSRLLMRLELVWTQLKDVPLNINISSYGKFVS